jgi:RNA recognition motif-containing protein
LLKGGGMNIYIGNLSLETTEDELRKTFAAFGEVTSVILMNDKYIGSGQTSGYGFVQMTSKSAGMAAIAGLAGKKVRDRLISIIEALPLSEKNSQRSPALKKGNRPGRSRQRLFQVI